MLYYCNTCNNYFETDGFEQCPHCFAVGDELEPIEDIPEAELTDSDIDDMYEQAVKMFRLSKNIDYEKFKTNKK